VFATTEMLLALILWWWAPKEYSLGIGAVILVEALRAIYFTIAMRFPFRIKGTWAHFIELIRFGTLPMIAVLLTTVNYKVDVLILGNMSGVSAASIGVYAVGMALAEKATTVSDAMREVLAS